ncbi:MAG: hypothetical protein QM770_16555 [Tepidisphaeraceae bacterium]
MRMNVTLATALTVVSLGLAGCNEQPVATKPMDMSALTPDIKAAAHLNPDVEILNVEELDYSKGTKMVRIRYKTPEGLVDTVDVSQDTVLTPAKVFENK